MLCSVMFCYFVICEVMLCQRNKLHEDIPGVQEEVPGECSWKGIDSDREGEKRMEGKRKAERARAKGKAEERKER